MHCCVWRPPDHGSCSAPPFPPKWLSFVRNLYSVAQTAKIKYQWARSTLPQIIKNSQPSHLTILFLPDMIFQKLGFLALTWSASGVFALSLVFNSEAFDIESLHAGDCCDFIQGVLPFHEPADW